MGKVDRNSLKNVKEITWKLQHNLVIVGIDKKQKTECKPGLSQKRSVAKIRG